MAAPTTVITIVKDFTYKNVPGEEWSNTYMLTGTTPADSTAWRALFDAIVVEEKKNYITSVRVTRAYGYDRVPATGDHAIWSVDLRPSSTTVAGTFALGANTAPAGDQAGWVRWSLDRFNSKGKRIYLRKYFHGCCTDGSITNDSLPTALKTAYQNYGNFMMGGTLLGSRKICDKLGNVPIAAVGSAYVTTRTLKRRSKRPPA